MIRKLAIAAAVLGSLLVAPGAHAAINDVFGGAIPCTNFDNGTPDTSDDQRRCGAGANEVQRLTRDATAGTFTLTFDGETTSALAFDANAAAVDAALEALPNIGAAEVSVTNETSPAGSVRIAFGALLARQNLAEITVDTTNLTGTAVITTLTQGEPSSVTGTFDGIPIDVNVAFPPASQGDGPFPLLIWGHGYGGAKIGFSSMKRYTDRGYAVFSMTDRGFHESCGTPISRQVAGVACDDGFVRLMDTRYEVRDAQLFAGILNDEGVADGLRVGALGGSYGGGLSMALAALKDRVMNTDGSLEEWLSPLGDPMRIAGAVPNIPWTDLAYSLVPNGSTLDYVTDGRYRGRFGVMKQSLVNGLYLSGITSGEGVYAPPGTPGADLTGWKALLDAGESYDTPQADAVLTEFQDHHSSYYIDDSVAPAPMLISSGFTDDLFPADEAIRFYNKTRTLHSGTPISLFFGDFGHQRAANKTDVTAALNARNDAWLDFYVRGTGAAPPQGVETFSLTCPKATPSGGPFTAANWALLPPGEVRLTEAAPRTIAANAGDPAIAARFDPVGAGSGNPPGDQGACNRVSGADQAGAASYRLPAAAGSGYTLMGAATVIADISSPVANSQLVARLLDVDPGTGQESLVSRAVLRPAVGSAKQVFQLHPNGWRFAPGHVAKLELLPNDSSGSAFASYARASNGQGAVTVSNLELRLPVLDRPGASNGAVKVQRDKFVPLGYTLTADAASIANDANATIAGGKLKGTAKTLKVAIGSPAQWEACHATVEVLRGGAANAGSAAKGKKKGKRLVIARGSATVPGGSKGVAKLKLTKKARKQLKGGKLKVTVQVVTAEQDGTVSATRTALLPKRK